MEETTVNLDEVRALAMADERARVASITNLCREHSLDDKAQAFIERGASVPEAQSEILAELAKRAKQPATQHAAPAQRAQPIASAPDLHLSAADSKRYSITAGIRAALTGDWSSYEAGMVRELSTEVQKSMGRGPSAERAFFVPLNELTRATYVTSGASTGGNLVATDLLDQEFIEFLRNR